MRERREMEVGDWFNAAINLGIGILLGSVIHGLLQLVSSGSWQMALIILFLAAGLFLFMVLSDKLLDRLFQIGIRPAKTPQAPRPNPLLRVLSLPAGFVLGVVLAVLGFDRTILDFLP